KRRRDGNGDGDGDGDNDDNVGDGNGNNNDADDDDSTTMTKTTTTTTISYAAGGGGGGDVGDGGRTAGEAATRGGVCEWGGLFRGVEDHAPRSSIWTLTTTMALIFAFIGRYRNYSQY
ncbi:hypothetical protein ACHAW5_010815, partial [Stephanodiscus triporus]